MNARHPQVAAQWANLALAVAAVALFCVSPQAQAQPPKSDATAKALSDEREKLDATLWAQEVAAQKHEDVIVRFWDELRARNNAWDVWEKLRFDKLRLGEPGKSEKRDHGIVRSSLGSPTRALSPDDFRKEIARLRDAGYEITQTDWHHSQFDQPKGAPQQGITARSIVSFGIHATRREPVERIIIKGKLGIEWSGDEDLAGKPIPATISTLEIDVLTRAAEAPFREMLSTETSERRKRLMPLLLYDLDGDGLSEIILGGLSRIYRNLGNGKFRAEPLASTDLDMFDAAILADFTGDRNVDLVYVDQERKPMLLAGNREGRFLGTPTQCAAVELELPKSFTAADIDADGDLDLFIGQYKFPYVEGSMPTPFYDANDGYPAMLLENDGRGAFRDITEKAGLAKKRHRRTFSSSLVDFDDDGDQDLVTVNDFCGVDLYTNDGRGKFTDVTEQLGDDRHLFGMAHTFADYNLDGRLDMYGIGMSSTTARRLHQMGIGRADKPDITAKRMKMGYGNRMLLGVDQNGRRGFAQSPTNDQVARTGWSWGTTSPDFDNDGDRDIFVVNGHNSGQSAKDYCTKYWCHDVYTGTSKADTETSKLFGESLSELHRGEISWNGFENDVLWMNDSGKNFIDIAFLMGVAFQFDGRAAAADDLDADGRPDLLLVEYRNRAGMHAHYRLHALRNTLDTGNHWIGVRLRDEKGRSPIGARVTVTTGDKKQIGRYVTGDSFSAQHAPTLHFGLGNTTTVDALEVQWPDGKKRRLERPAIDRYHPVSP